VKPANVIVTTQDHATLTDFSIAQAVNPGATRSATIAGTPLYMSPEQIQGKDLDSRSDIYSAGLVLFEMCVGHPPFQGQFVTVMYAHLHSPVPDIRSTVPRVPESLSAIIYRCLAKDRAERYQTAGEVVRALERAAPKSEVDVRGTVRLSRGQMDELLSAQPYAVENSTTPEKHAAGGRVTAEALKARRVWDSLPVRWRSRLTLGLGIIVILLILFLVFEKFHTSSTHKKSASAPAGIAVAMAFVTLECVRDPATRRPHVGVPLSSLPSKQTAGKVVWAVSELRLVRGSPSSARNFHLRYSLYGPSGHLLGSSAPSTLTLSIRRPEATFTYGFQFPLAVPVSPPVGRYTVSLAADGRTLKRVFFGVS
jgi:serine/threonine-protein kinase